MIERMPNYAERAKSFFGVLDQWHHERLFSLPFKQRYDIEGNRWRVALAMAAARRKNGGLPHVPPGLWRFILRSMCGYGARSVA